MLIVGDNLKYLVEQHRIVNNDRSYDVNSLTLTLDRCVITVEPDDNAVITYGHAIPAEWIKEHSIKDEGFLIPAKSSILGCSHEIINMPVGYFGFLQTKGSLARLFVLVNLCDGQVEAGYSGKVTFEISNMSDFGICLRPNQPVAQLFIFKTSTRLVEPYHGRYQGATKPTIQLPED
jgi:dCTP deaminase